MKSTLKDVSIVIVTYKGDELTKNCLDSLEATCGSDPQIVVVDNSPSEATRLLVASYPNTVYVSSPGNPGFAGGNNRAMPECDRPYVLLLNNDTIVRTRESIERLVGFLDEHPRCGVAQGTATLKDGKSLAGCGSYLMPFGYMWAPGFGKEDDVCNATAVRFSAIGFFMIFRRSILRNVGGSLFRTHFWCYYEETDFCHRVWLAGYEVWYVKTPPIIHLCGGTVGHFKHVDIMERYQKNILFSLNSNLSLLSRLFILPCFTTLLAIHGLVHLLRGHADVFVADMRSLASPIRNRPKILAARRQISRIRKVSDFKIFNAVMRLPPFPQLVRFFLSNA